MKKILIVDDQQGWLKFHSAALFKVLGDDIFLVTASSAQEGYSKLLENVKEPFDYVLTDMQMETDYMPKMAGEWLIEQIQTLPSFYKTKIVIISASPKIKQIADLYHAFYIPKRMATISLEVYKEVLL